MAAAGQEPAAHVGSLPVFANQKNVELDQRVREHEKKLAQLTQEVADNQERLGFMQQHTKNLEQQLVSAQNILDAKNNSAANEAHLAKVAERQVGKIRQETEQLRKDNAGNTAKTGTLVAQLQQMKDKMEEFQKEMQWSEEQVAKWAEEQRKKEEDNLTILKYSLADEARIKELSLAIEKISKELLAKQAFLDAQITDTHATQIEISKTEKQYKALHAEHQQLIVQCEETLAEMQYRDQAIEKLRTQEGLTDKSVLELQQIVREKQKFLEQEQLNNQQLEAKISLADRTVVKKRSVYGASHQGIQQFQDELDTIRMTLQKTKSTKDAKLEEIKNMSSEIEAQQKRIDQAKHQWQETQLRASTEYKSTDDLEQRAKELDSFLKQEEVRIRQVDKDLSTLKQDAFKAAQELHHLRTTESNLITEIQGSQTAGKNLQTQIHRLDTESMKQQELIYNQEFQLQDLEHKIARSQGERTSQEKAALNIKIKDLTEELQQEIDKYNLVTAQHKKILDEVRTVKREVSELQTEREQFDSRIQTLTLENESASAALKGLVKQKEEQMIQENCVRLDVRRLRDILYKQADEVYSLEAWKRQQALDMEEAKHNMHMEIEALRAKLRVTQDDRHVHKIELKTRELKVDKLKKKYELMITKMATPEGGQEERSQAYYVIKAAQEKEELRAIGDELNSKIEQAETEIRGLENTLNALNDHNQRLHVLKNTKDMSASDFEQKQFLEQELKSAQNGYQERVQALEDARQMLENMKVRLQAELMLREQQFHSVNVEMGELASKLERAKKNFRKLSTDQKKVDSVSVADEELELETKKDEVAVQLSELAKFVAGHPDIKDEVVKTAKTFNLELPEQRLPSAGRVLASQTLGSTSGSQRLSSTSGSRHSVTSNSSRGPKPNTRQVATPKATFTVPTQLPAVASPPQSRGSTRSDTSRTGTGSQRRAVGSAGYRNPGSAGYRNTGSAGQHTVSRNGKPSPDLGLSVNGAGV